MSMIRWGGIILYVDKEEFTERGADVWVYNEVDVWDGCEV
jgi:hypothetical protein